MCWHIHPCVEHQWKPHREREHIHGAEPADHVLLRVRDERVGHAERHRDGTLRWRGSGKGLQEALSQDWLFRSLEAQETRQIVMLFGSVSP